MIYITLDKTCYRLETMILKREEEDFLYTRRKSSKFHGIQTIRLIDLKMLIFCKKFRLWCFVFYYCDILKIWHLMS